MVYILIRLPEEVISEPISFCHYLGFKKLKIITNQNNQLCSNAYDDIRKHKNSISTDVNFDLSISSEFSKVSKARKNLKNLKPYYQNPFLIATLYNPHVMSF